MSIRILDEGTINKIAAGEVIERPASALKELLENSADSGATRVEVNFEAGGKTELKVTDDGCGIPADELTLAVERHATSKISSIDDLTGLETFGFRGEALSSLAAVSELLIHSSPHSATAGAKIRADGGKISASEPAAPVKGTHVTVRNLFSNVPARLKFLKSDAGETAAVKRTVKAFALGHPQLSIVLRQSGKALHVWERDSFSRRAASILGVHEKDSLFIEKSEMGMKLKALLVLPHLNLSTQQGIWIFVQGRPVTDRTIQQSVIEGYRNLVMQHQYPQAVISLTVNPGEVDVNVHPTKAQVKFTNNAAIFRFISSSIKEVLENHFSGLGRGTDTGAGTGWSIEQQVSFVSDAVTQYNRRAFQTLQTSFENPTPGNERADNGGSLAQSGPWSSLQVIGQFANTYIVCQSLKGLVLVDQHAAHERVLFERLKNQFKTNSIEKQGALVEEHLDLPRESIELLTDSKFAEVFSRLGFELTDRGPSTLTIAARPAFLIDVPLFPLFERLAEQLSETGSAVALDDVTTDIWASMACHGAIRAGRVLSAQEMAALLMQMDEFSFSSFCPHGRPVSVQWSQTELEKLFKRIV